MKYVSIGALISKQLAVSHPNPANMAIAGCSTNASSEN